MNIDLSTGGRCRQPVMNKLGDVIPVPGAIIAPRRLTEKPSKARVCNEMDADALRSFRLGRCDIVRNVIQEENRPAGSGRQCRDGRSFQPVIGDNRIGHVLGHQIRLTLGLGVLTDIGQNDDLRELRQVGKGRGGTRGCVKIVAVPGVEGLEEGADPVIGHHSAGVSLFDIAVNPETLQIKAAALTFQEPAETIDEEQ